MYENRDELIKALGQVLPCSMTIRRTEWGHSDIRA